ncbi:MAG: hypothetical protein ACRD2J_00715 [Thermoanaerobaculia bacterium]
MADDLRALLETMREENAAAHSETRRHSEETAAGTRRHFDVTSEQMERRFDTLAEAVSQVDAKVDRHGEELRGEMRRCFSETQAMIKFSHR